MSGKSNTQKENDKIAEKSKSTKVAEKNENTKATEKKYHHGNLRQALIEAGIEMMNEVGEDGMSLRKIAAKCGVSNAAPYAHFESLEDMIHGMQEYVTEEFVHCLEKAVEQCAHPDSEEIILDMGIAYVTFFTEHPQYFKFIFFRDFAKIDFSMEKRDSFPPFEMLKEQVIRLNKMSEKEMPKEEQELFILKLWSDVQGLASIASMPNVAWNYPWQDTIGRILCYHEQH